MTTKFETEIDLNDWNRDTGVVDLVVADFAIQFTATVEEDECEYSVTTSEGYRYLDEATGEPFGPEQPFTHGFSEQVESFLKAKLEN